MIDDDKLRKSLKHLEYQLANHNGAPERTELSRLDREAIAESVIQRFETCYDTLWKYLKRHMTETLGLPNVPASPKPLFKLAAQNNQLPSPVEHWLAYANARIATSHDYSGKKAEETLAMVDAFLEDAKALYRTMTEQDMP